ADARALSRRRAARGSAPRRRRSPPPSARRCSLAPSLPARRAVTATATSPILVRHGSSETPSLVTPSALGPAGHRRHRTSDAHLFHPLRSTGVVRNLCARPLCGTSLPVGTSSLLPRFPFPPSPLPPPPPLTGALFSAGAPALA